VLTDRKTRSTYKLSADYCHDRFCGPCTASRAATVATNLNDRIDPVRCRFLTLTFYTELSELKATVAELFAAFVRLRRSRSWIKHVKGGAAFLEVKYNAGPGRWHAHLHVLIEGVYYPHELIKRDWLVASKRSTVVDVRRLKSREHAVSYVTKYCTKAIDNATTLIPARFDEAIIALKGTRTMTTFGEWRSLRLTKCIVDGDYVVVAPLDELLHDARNGKEEAVTILSLIRSHGPWTQSHRNLQRTLHPPNSRSLFDLVQRPTAQGADVNSQTQV